MAPDCPILDIPPCTDHGCHRCLRNRGRHPCIGPVHSRLDAPIPRGQRVGIAPTTPTDRQALLFGAGEDSSSGDLVDIESNPVVSTFDASAVSVASASMAVVHQLLPW